MSILDALVNSADTSIPITALRSIELQNWLESQDDKLKSWVRSSGFEARSAETCLIPDQDGQLSQVLLGVSPTLTIWSLAALPLSLPQGVYQLDASFDSDKHTDLALGWALGSYQYTRYKKPRRAAAQLLMPPGCDEVLLECQALGIDLTRNLINTPAQDMMPEDLAEAAQTLAETFGGEFSSTVGHELLQHNYPTIHAVGRASDHPPQLIDIHWGNKAHPKVTLVGKGVCFDSGGLDLKPANAMRWMKKDMGGAAHVLGLANMIMAYGLPIRLRVLIPAVENAVAGNAFRPGDVLTTRSGKTVEIDNTDAEGRLVLCDALSEAVSEDPELLIDMATLTGAARVAMGPDVPAIFANRRASALQLLETSDETCDPVWPMPLHQDYKRWLKSDIADMMNCTTTGLGGAITAGLFLQSFVDDQRDWLHMDVMAFNNENLPGRPRGGEAMGLRSFFAWLRTRYAKKPQAVT